MTQLDIIIMSLAVVALVIFMSGITPPKGGCGCRM